MPKEAYRFRASIIIVNYNGGEVVLKCLASVIASIGPDTEVIVVDNASTDGSREAIEAGFAGLRLISSGRNLGFGAGNNLGAGQTSGKFLVFINPDTLVNGDWLGPLLDALDQNNGVGLATAKIVMANDPALINTCGNRVHLTGLTLCRGLRSPSSAFDRAEDVDAVSGAAFAITRSLFEELGGFDEEMFLYIEDTDLSLRARLSGWRCVYTPGSIIQHDYRLKITPLKIYYQEKNRYLMLLKELRWATLIVLFPALLAAEVISWGFVVTMDRSNFKNKIKAYKWVLSNWRLILRKRRQTQRLRKNSDRAILRTMAVRLDFGQAAPRPVSAIAHLIFDPFFLLIKALILLVVWW